MGSLSKSEVPQDGKQWKARQLGSIKERKRKKGFGIGGSQISGEIVHKN